MSGYPKEIHGNQAKVPKGKKIAPEFIANTVTMACEKNHETPVVPDGNVAYAKEFVEENKK